MDALILSCGTGGGHNSAGAAVAEELIRRSFSVETLDPYSLAGDGVAHKVGNAYIKLIQKSPRTFGLLYGAAQGVRNIPFHSPVYWANALIAERMAAYLSHRHFDVAVMPHLFPAEIFTYMKEHGYNVPKSVFIATDYTCIPFTEETCCDYYITPSPLLSEDFIRRGIPADKLRPFGIPVRSQFHNPGTKAQARKRLALDATQPYILLSGGSIGAGKLEGAIACLLQSAQFQIIAICGNNDALYARLSRQYAGCKKLQLIKSTPDIADYMRACDLYISKPGGLSSTEAAVMGIPLAHYSPIPGCESFNMQFFTEHGMALRADKDNLYETTQKLMDPENAQAMIRNQKEYINAGAATEIGNFIESLCRSQRQEDAQPFFHMRNDAQMALS